MTLLHYASPQKNLRLSSAIDVVIEKDISKDNKNYLVSALDLLIDSYDFKGLGDFEASLTQKTGVINLIPQKNAVVKGIVLKKNNSNWQKIENSRQTILLYDDVQTKKAYTYILFK